MVPEGNAAIVCLLRCYPEDIRKTKIASPLHTVSTSRRAAYHQQRGRRLTGTDRAAIRHASSTGRSLRSLASEYGVSHEREESHPSVITLRKLMRVVVAEIVRRLAHDFIDASASDMARPVSRAAAKASSPSCARTASIVRS